MEAPPKASMTTVILYKHPQDDRCLQQCATRADLPPWAVDAREVEGPLNAWGLKAHPSDELVHWQDAPGTPHELRRAWDKLEAAGLLAEAQLLMRAAANVAAMDAAELAAGEDI